ncbi:sel1 repeat family protein [Pseudomonas sp. GD03721]|uniref:tetratricopeptide repeat protein n=1 Tax=Pseudomonas sp. Marseille-Q0931 TaxID=2697507 RepID=UPI0023B986E3|nr:MULTISPECIES: tetratricopeptide repeat protein [unclassified Pseudomonas]MDH1444028.1 sel1 repeat family protein [Pseudomonas sp. GD03722]WGG00759.1 sel1 repeat family protein [Pseudomonas sp. GD03721]WGG04925.1 sel1 repeat family protein [Pseudomonas sp. GD03919]
MSKSADVFNLMDNLLPRAEYVELAEPDELQRLYAGIGMPSLRAMELSGQAGVTYHEIRAANPLLGLVDPVRIRNRYVELREQALLGDADALNDLGWFWLNGMRLKQNPALARRLFKISAVMGSAEALFNLAEQAFYGKGLEVNPSLAVDYYEQAFEAGIPCAAQALGSLYERGDEGVIVDHGKAISWYKRGAAEQDLMACFSLGRLALDESSPEYDPALGLYWLQWAAMKGQVQATERLTDFYFYTFESPPDPEGLLFRFWRDLAVKQGSMRAMELSALDSAIFAARKSS